MHQRGGLLAQRFGYRRVRMPQAANGDAAERIQVLLVLVIPKPCALTANKSDRLAFVGMHQCIAHVA